MFIEKIMNILLRSVLVIFFIHLSGCATGSHIVTGESRPPTDPSDVKLYIEPPPEYETVGLIEASSDVELSTQAAQDRAIQELKNQAAKIGANGVLLLNVKTTSDTSGYISDGVYYSYDTETKNASGKAIFVP